MGKVSGYQEHLSMVYYVLKEVRAKKSSVASVWLDTANVYGSIPHIVIIFCPSAIVESYFARIFSKSFYYQQLTLTSTWNIFRLHNFYYFIPCRHQYNLRILFASKRS